uniref:NADH dehydrogenase subunit 6 n=1 Tax=Gammarus lacustris TaxID=52639 RepID=A0A517LS50_9CRUS|nr:NADH dehydrogenase subunit 6 [Gammarus lacustris]QDS78460.1 NADH dehydrogenase subunit 6 [Gammarus lacustris]
MVALTYILSMSFSWLLIFSKTPLTMAALIILQAFMVSFITFMFLLSSWFSFILFMVFISAMMVIFVYVSSLASNDFFTAPSPYLLLILFSVPFVIIFMALVPTSVPNQSHSQIFLSDLHLGSMVTYKLYSSYILATTIFLIIYLLVALIVVAKNSSSSKGALRALNP